MIKKTISFKNFDGVDVSKDYYFHYSKPELLEMEIRYPKGLKQELERIFGGGDAQEIIGFVKGFVLGAYGVRNADSSSFIKTEDATREFEQSIAYEKLFMELAFNAPMAAEFLNGVIPQDLEESITGILAEQGMTVDDLLSRAEEMQKNKTAKETPVVPVTSSLPPIPPAPPQSVAPPWPPANPTGA